MSLHVSIAVRVRAGSHYSLHQLSEAIRRAGVGSEDRRGHSVGRAPDDKHVDVIQVAVIVDDPDAFKAALTEALASDGLEVLSAAEVSVKVVEPQKVNAPGVHYDRATGTLTVETWSPDWGDVVIDLLRTTDAIRGLMATTSPRVEDGLFGLQHIIVKRPAGGPVTG